MTCAQDNVEESDQATVIVEEPKPCDKKKQEPYALDHMTVDFTGDFDPESFLHYLSRFPMPQGRVRIRMEVTAE